MGKSSVKILLISQRLNAHNIMQDEIRSFNEKHPDIHIQVDVIPWTHAWDQIIYHIKERSGPDIIQVGNSWAGPLSMFNGFRDLTKTFRKMLENDFSPAAVQTCKHPVTSRIICVPWFFESRMLYYRRDIMEQFNISLDDIATLEGFEDACAKIHNRVVNNKTISAIGTIRYIDPVLVQDMAPWIWNFGGRFISTDGKKITLADKEALSAIRLYYYIVNNYTHLENYFSYNTLSDNFFVHKKYAFVFMNTWPLFYYLNEKNDYYYEHKLDLFDITTIPRGTQNDFTFAGGSNLAIMKYSNKFDEAVEFVKFLISKDSKIRYNRYINSFPSNLKAFERSLKTMGQFTDTIRTCHERSRFFPVHPHWGSMEIIFGEAFSRIMNFISVGKYSNSLLRKEMQQVSSQVQYLIDL